MKTIALYPSTIAPFIGSRMNNPRFVPFCTNNMTYNIIRGMYGDLVEFGKEYELKQEKITLDGNEINILYFLAETETSPFAELNAKAGLPPNAMGIRPSPLEKGLGLSNLGFLGAILGEMSLADFPFVHEETANLTSPPTRIKHSAYKTPNDEDFVDSTVEKSYEEDPNIMITMDARLEIAVQELLNEGETVKVSLLKDGDYQIVDVSSESKERIKPFFNFNSEINSCPGAIPLVPENQHVIDRAMEYYKNKSSIPADYRWLESVIPLDILTLWFLPTDENIQLRIINPDDASEFGDRITGYIEERIHPRSGLPERVFHVTWPDGTEFTIEDIVFHETHSAPFAVEGPHRTMMQDLGITPVNILEWKRGLVKD